MEIRFISFSVDGQIISRTDTTPIVQDSQNYLWAEFELSEEWEGQITAVFKGKDGQAFNVLVSRGECQIPWEVLTQPWFEVSAFCENLITANVVRIYTIKSGYEIGEESRTPTPDIYTQIINKIDGINAFTVPYENSDLGVENVGDALDVLAEGGGGGGGGTTPNIHMTAEVDATTGTPDVEVTKTGTLTNPIFNLAFTGLKGETGSAGPQGPTGETGPKGDTGETPIISATATVTSSTGTPAVNVTKSGTDEAPSFAFAFSGIKGETGTQGPTGETGPAGATGATPTISATGSVTNTTGTPSVTITKTGTAESPNFDFAFSNIKGAKGDDGEDGSVVTVTQTLQSGTKIGSISVDGNSTDLFAPSGGGSSTVTQFEVTTSGWTADSTSQSGSTLYKKSIALSTVNSTFGLVSIGATGTLPTVAQQTAYDLLQYVTIDSAVPCLYLYASDIPTDAFYIKVEGVA